MWLFVPGVPLGLGLLLWVLGRLESRYVEPIDRATKISRMLDGSPIEQVEEEVARMLAPYVEQAVRKNPPLRPQSPAA